MLKKYKNTHNRLKSEVKEYINSTKKNSDFKNKYMKTLRVLNKKTDKVYSLEYDLQKNYRKTYIDFIQKSIHITKISEEQNLDQCIFGTITLNTQYHKYTNKGKNYNKNYNEDLTIEKGYQKLQHTFTQIRKELGKNDEYRTKIESKYIKVFENHTDLTVHLHFLLFFNSENLERVIKIIGNKLKSTSQQTITKNITDKDNKKVKSTKIEYNYNIEKNKDNHIGKSEIEIIENVKKGVGYLSKYIKKSFMGSEEELYLLEGWKRENNLRLVHTSNIEIPKYIYTKVNNLISKVVKDNLIEKEINILDYIIENTKVVYVVKGLENDYEEDKHYLDKYKYLVKVYKREKKVIGSYKYGNIREEVNKLVQDSFFGKEITIDKLNYFLNSLNEEDRELLIDLKREELEVDYSELCSTENIDTKWYEEIIGITCNKKELLREIFKIMNGKYNNSIIKKITNIEIFEDSKLVYNKEDFELFRDLRTTEI